MNTDIKRDRSIYDEWDRIVFRERPRDCDFAPDAQEAWQKLWDNHIAGSRLASTNLDDAGLICSLGWQLAMRAGEYPTALERIDTWFAHPMAIKADAIDISMHRCKHARTNLFAGDFDVAIAELRDLLDKAPERERYRNRLMVRNELVVYMDHQPQQSVAPQKFTDLVADTIQQFPGNKRLADKLRNRGLTFAQLLKGLEATYRKASNHDVRSR